MTSVKDMDRNNRQLDEKFMRRCLQLARNGLGSTAPNPMVGCVIVHGGKVLGEGYTSPYGGPHAEVNAINSVREKALLSKSIMYVTLEPCSHFGKTPPCVDLIIKNAIPKVVVGTQDPHEKVAGRGIEKLRIAGCQVTVGILEGACKKHHKRFLTFHQKKRPYVILKWAQTLDGFIAPKKDKRSKEPAPYWITNKHSRQLVHQWRSEEQAILVGTMTVLEDNPRLDVRHWKGENPIRVVLDRDLKMSQSTYVLDGTIKTIVLTQVDATPRNQKNILYKKIDYSENLADQILQILHQEHITSVIVEGGAQTIKTFVDSGQWDEARIFTGMSSFGDGTDAPKISGKLIDSRTIHEDVLKIMAND